MKGRRVIIRCFCEAGTKDMYKGEEFIIDVIDELVEKGTSVMFGRHPETNNLIYFYPSCIIEYS